MSSKPMVQTCRNSVEEVTCQWQRKAVAVGQGWWCKRCPVPCTGFIRMKPLCQQSCSAVTRHAGEQTPVCIQPPTCPCDLPTQERLTEGAFCNSCAWLAACWVSWHGQLGRCLFWWSILHKAVLEANVYSNFHLRREFKRCCSALPVRAKSHLPELLCII